MAAHMAEAPPSETHETTQPCALHLAYHLSGAANDTAAALAAFEKILSPAAPKETTQPCALHLACHLSDAAKDTAVALAAFEKMLSPAAPKETTQPCALHLAYHLSGAAKYTAVALAVPQGPAAVFALSELGGAEEAFAPAMCAQPKR